MRDDAIRRGDPDAFEALFDAHARVLVGWLRRECGDAELAADLTAETFATALARCGRFDPARGAAGAWLFGIARRLLADARRRGSVEDRARRRLGMRALELTDTAVERIDALASAEALRDALALLPADQRDAIGARVLADTSYSAIALGARTSESVIRKRVSRGLAGLRAQLEHEEGRP